MGVLVKCTGKKEPSLLTIEKKEDLYTYCAININITKTEDDIYTWDSIELPDYALDNIHNAEDDIKYNVLISHIVKAFYSDHAMTAIMSNYLSDMDSEKYKTEFEAMQTLRKTAKTISKHIVSNKLF